MVLGNKRASQGRGDHDLLDVRAGVLVGGAGGDREHGGVGDVGVAEPLADALLGRGGLGLPVERLCGTEGCASALCVVQKGRISGGNISHAPAALSWSLKICRP